MGFVDRTEPRFPSQGIIASHGGLIHRACAFFTVVCIQILPPPEGPEHPSRDIRKLDAWLSRLNKEHPLLFNLLALGLALIVFGLAMLLRYLLSGGQQS